MVRMIVNRRPVCVDGLQVIRLYRVSGASFQQAQQDFASAVRQSTATTSETGLKVGRYGAV